MSHIKSNDKQKNSFPFIKNNYSLHSKNKVEKKLKNLINGYKKFMKSFDQSYSKDILDIAERKKVITKFTNNEDQLFLHALEAYENLHPYDCNKKEVYHILRIFQKKFIILGEIYYSYKNQLYGTIYQLYCGKIPFNDFGKIEEFCLRNIVRLHQLKYLS